MTVHYMRKHGKPGFIIALFVNCKIMAIQNSETTFKQKHAIL